MLFCLLGGFCDESCVWLAEPLFLQRGAAPVGLFHGLYPTVCAKGNPAGQVLMILFSLLYGLISFSFAYYGEMLTYLGMTAPMAVVSLVSWLRNPFQGNHSEVEVNRLPLCEIPFMLVLTAAVTVVFYFLLRFFHTANLLPSTLSVTTSFLAVYLTFRRMERSLRHQIASAAPSI